jgi:hypothetical protein
MVRKAPGLVSPRADPFAVGRASAASLSGNLAAPLPFSIVLLEWALLLLAGVEENEGVAVVPLEATLYVHGNTGFPPF